MRVAAIFDIHGNLPALEAGLDEVRGVGVDRLVVGGDVVPGPMPKEAIAALLDLEVPVDFIRGDGETEILAILRNGSPRERVPVEHHDALLWVAQVSRTRRSHRGRPPVEALEDDPSSMA